MKKKVFVVPGTVLLVVALAGGFALKLEGTPDSSRLAAWASALEGVRGSGENGPGSASDPVLTMASFQQHLEHLLAQPRQQVAALEARLERVARGIQDVQKSLEMSFPDLRGHWAEKYVIFLRGKGIISGYPDGRFHPQDPVTRAALAVILVRMKNLAPDPEAAGFPDVTGHWAVGAIGAARAAGCLEGYPDGRFRPEKGVTRAEVAALICRAFTLEVNATSPGFRDLRGHWAAPAVKQLAAAGILGGYPDGTFRPDNTMSRAEVAGVLARILMSE